MIKTGDTVYLAIAERIDQFAHKRYSNPKVHRYRRILLKVDVLEVEGNEFKGKLLGNNGFEKDGQIFVFNIGDTISDPSKDIETRIGKWEEYSV